MEQKLERKYGLFTAICMVVGIVIGSGVFFKAQDILKMTGGDMPLGVIAWVIGGAIMMVCLLTFSFMGQKYEKVGGVVDYAEATCGKGYGYLMGWFVATVYFPSMTSVLCWVTATYTLDFLVSVNPAFPQEDNVVILMSFAVMALAFTINAVAPKLAGKLQTGTTVIKLIPLVLMAVVGVIYGLANGMLSANFEASPVVTDSTADSPLFAAVCSTAFAYEGWIIATSINAEIKDSKKNLPRALIAGGIIIAAIYIFYYLGVAGGATNQQLIEKGTTVAFANVFGGALGNVLKLFVAISCYGTVNGLMLATCRGMYSLAARGEGPAPRVLSRIHPKTNMPTAAALIGLALTVGWFGYFQYFLTHAAQADTVPFVFDSSELPIITIYLMYLPILVRWMCKEKEQPLLRRFVLPIAALCGSLFMIVASIFSHGWGCAWYLLVFAAVMAVGVLLNLRKKV
ncbi:MAG: APC family permease [Clostridia bacterium]|nr:APC family permease [Clostridia bacterium]